MIHAQLDANGICTGYGDLRNIESHPSLVFLQEGWDEDFLWRKYENGQWSVEKYTPPATVPTPSPEKLEIDQLKTRLASTEQSASDNSLVTQQLLETLIDMGVI